MCKACLLVVLAMAPVLSAQTAEPAKAPKVWTNDDFAVTKDAAHPDALPPIGLASPAKPTHVDRDRTRTKNPVKTADIKELEARIGVANARLRNLQKEYQTARERNRYSTNPQQLQRMRQIEREIPAWRDQIQELELKLAALRTPDQKADLRLPASY
jgi:hypothetical protein